MPVAEMVMKLLPVQVISRSGILEGFGFSTQVARVVLLAMTSPTPTNLLGERAPATMLPKAPMDWLFQCEPSPTGA